MAKKRIRLTKRQMAMIRRARLKRGFAALKGKTSVPKKLALKTHTFVERTLTEDFMNVKTAPATTDGIHKSWALSQLRQATHYRNIFEQYKINKVVVTFRYKAVGTAAGATSDRPNEINPILYIKRDHNDDQLATGGNLETLSELKDSSKTFEVQLTNNKPNFSMTIKPAILMEDGVYSGSAGVSHVPVWGKWIDVREQNVNYYGLKAYAVGQGSSSGDSLGKIEVSYKVYFSCKNNE
jgi:hypothetical protein